MSELTNYVGNREETPGRLTFKFFCGQPKEVEKQLNDFLCEKPICIHKILQSESGTDEFFSVTVTVAYYDEGKPHFLGEQLTAEILANNMSKYIEDFWGIKISDIQEAIFSKQNEALKNNNKQGEQNEDVQKSV